MSHRIARLLVAAAILLPTCSSLVQANCTQSNMPVFQCDFVGWFAPAPPGSGQIGAAWWQLGYGNDKVSVVYAGPPLPAIEGTGMAGPLFSGNDSGHAITQVHHVGGPYQPGLTLTEARDVLPQYAAQIPIGSTCLNRENTWSGAGIDGCADNPRTVSSITNDNFLNPYFNLAYGPCPYPSYCEPPYYTTDYQIDYPMAVLVRESSNRFFALAFVASKPRPIVGDDPMSRGADFLENYFDLAEVSNGDPNPTTTGPGAGKFNIIPWQPVPTPRLELTTPSPSDPNMFLVDVAWDPVRLVHDGSFRPNLRTSAPLFAGGVGVLEHLAEPGGFCRYQIQNAPLSSDPNGLTWANIGAPIPCTSGYGAVRTSLTVPNDSALRIRTILGKTPRTTTTSLAACRLGACGDLGFEATRCADDNCASGPPVLVLGGAPVSEQAVDTVALRSRNTVTVRFRTTAELTVTGIDILGKADAVLASVPCNECTSAAGADYEVGLTAGSLKGARELRVRLNGPGAVSPPFPVQ